MGNKAVFVDRDGTINVDVHYLHDPGQFQMYPGVGEGLRSLKEAGFKIIVITNQSGIGRGYFTEEQLKKVHDRMKSDLHHFGVTLDGIYVCPHHPEERCNCRKPRTGLFERAIKDNNIDLTGSFMIGDKSLDVEAGKKIGVQTILIPEPHIRGECLSKQYLWGAFPDFIANDFLAAVDWIQGKNKVLSFNTSK